jgi:hypothetical protein
MGFNSGLKGLIDTNTVTLKKHRLQAPS